MSDAIVHVFPQVFLTLVQREERPLGVTAPGGFWSRTHRYLFGHKGLVFYTESGEPLQLPGRAEVFVARRIWIPG